MTITASVRAIVAQALRNKGWSKNQLADAIGVRAPWITKFFNGKLQTLSDDKAQAMEQALEFKFFRLIDARDKVPEAAIELGKVMTENPRVAELVGALLNVVGPKVIHELPFFETEELRQIGEEMTRIVHRWEQPKDPHYGRIGREAVEFFSRFTRERGKTPQSIEATPDAFRDLGYMHERLGITDANTIDFLGGIAAGAQISNHLAEAEMRVEKDYPDDHYALQVFGQSMEPKIPNGSIIVVRRFQDQGFPKKGTIVVYNDGHGATLKEFGYRKATSKDDPETVNSMGHVPVLRSLNPTFKEVQTMEGGRIDAVFVEVL